MHAAAEIEEADKLYTSDLNLKPTTKIRLYRADFYLQIKLWLIVPIALQCTMVLICNEVNNIAFSNIFMLKVKL